jgi:hypothetical protein
MIRTLVTAALLLTFAPFAAADDRIALTVDTSEADAVLAILSAKPADADWQKLFATEPYVRLKKREASMKRDFTDDDFKNFVRSPELAAQAPELRRALAAWKHADLRATAQRVLAYLPADARIHAKVFPVIKPKQNSFVFETNTDPTIFLYLDRAKSAAQFENTVGHELHHIGYASISPRVDTWLKTLPPNVQPAVDWMGAFGEGIAMLAAAGSTDVHPHAASNPNDRARWDGDMANFNRDLQTLDSFFRDIIEGRLAGEAAQRERGMSFFGVQGPWYTVGYKMAVMVEKRYGRAALIACMEDPRRLLRRYNLAVVAYNATHADKLERWSAELMEALGGGAQFGQEPDEPLAPAGAPQRTTLLP